MLQKQKTSRSNGSCRKKMEKFRLEPLNRVKKCRRVPQLKTLIIYETINRTQVGLAQGNMTNGTDRRMEGFTQISFADSEILNARFFQPSRWLRLDSPGLPRGARARISKPLEYHDRSFLHC